MSVTSYDDTYHSYDRYGWSGEEPPIDLNQSLGDVDWGHPPEIDAGLRATEEESFCAAMALAEMTDLLSQTLAVKAAPTSDVKVAGAGEDLGKVLATAFLALAGRFKENAGSSSALRYTKAVAETILRDVDPRVKRERFTEFLQIIGRTDTQPAALHSELAQFVHRMVGPAEGKNGGLGWQD